MPLLGILALYVKQDMNEQPGGFPDLECDSVLYIFAAYCKNSVDGQWYCFDDSEVQPIADEDVCQQTAYILFYQRRTAIPSWSANSSVAGESPHSVVLNWMNGR